MNFDFIKKRTEHAKKITTLDDLEQRFSLQRVFYETPHALAYDAEDKVAKNRVFLWKLRLPVKEDLAEKILQNAFLPIVKSGLYTPIVTCFGVAKKTTLFYATPQVSAPSVLSKEIAPRKKGLLAARMIRFVSHLHESKMFLGCLHESSFLVNRDETLFVNGLFPVLPGHIDFDDVSTAVVEFTAPEVRAGQSPNSTSDVFSLGAYIYHLLSNHEFPIHLEEQQLYQHLRIKIPEICTKENRAEWLEPLLFKMLQWKPERRFENAQEVFEEVEEACPELGMFGVGNLKSIDRAASSYIMSPFTQSAVATLTVALMLSIALHRFDNPDTLVVRRWQIAEEVEEEVEEPVIEEVQEEEHERMFVKLRNKEYGSNSTWANDKNSALIHLLRFGTFSYDPSEPICERKHIWRRTIKQQA